MTTKMHEPTPEFARYLEWQVVTEVRRQSRFAEPAKPAYGKYLGVAAMMIVSMLIGAGGVTAAGRMQVNQQKQRLLDQQQGEVQLAEMQLALAQKAADSAKRRVSLGISDSAESATSERDLRIASLSMERAKLNLQEVGLSAQPVQDDLTSPLVGGRDFVAERLRLDQQAAAISADVAQQKVNRSKRLVDVGVADNLELLQVQAELARVTSELQIAQDKIALRQRFQSGSITAAEVTRQRQLLSARSELAAAESALSVATKRYERVQSLVQKGLATEVEMLKAQLEMLSKRQDVVALQTRIQQLQRDETPAASVQK